MPDCSLGLRSIAGGRALFVGVDGPDDGGLRRLELRCGVGAGGNELSEGWEDRDRVENRPSELNPPLDRRRLLGVPSALSDGFGLACASTKCDGSMSVDSSAVSPSGVSRSDSDDADDEEDAAPIRSASAASCCVCRRTASSRVRFDDVAASSAVPPASTPGGSGGTAGGGDERDHELRPLTYLLPRQISSASSGVDT